ncbi:FAD binding domain of DNA photolyase domain-containing protein [Toxoplasma gondii GT1]|uniref:Deoxyribodipyrimidine photo-lyase n=5 Tax=Toxoplasma gondii TaxID=5811 RepID=S7UTS7_TOXGG|nr:FAD binding domain of DNA photolyase domain-containing protein [Toxoplasma gondii GT1]KAF4642635.1 FAD binding domain of DNA photolyase domain-containing protein [Toxoplasma gondii]KFH00514.1 FAD binding domain of DNA photolyase domain-containing protein [Toxoplasma gondii VAND]
MRVQDNWALLLAQEAARSLNKPLVVIHLLVPGLAFQPTRRHLSFFMGGAREVETELKSLNIGFELPIVSKKDPKGRLDEANKKIEEVFDALQPALAVCDFNPLRLPTQVVEALTRVYAECLSPLYQVDTHGVVPCWVASDKLETAARTLRPKLMELVKEFATPFPKVQRMTVPWTHTKLFPLDEDRILSELKPDPPEPLDSWKPGTKAALELLHSFATPKNLAEYGKSRNDPVAGVQSDLSPYIHFGHISVQRCLLEVSKLKSTAADKTLKEGVMSFIDEVVVRSQLSDNFVFFNPHYDDIKGAPLWAQQTLNIHAKDKREPHYGFAALEAGKTYDELWNAAQLQLVRDGKMHGYLRMYWAKKILEWTKSPQEALKIAIALNDKYHLDGTDPNGVTGCMWSICGVHDQGFKERPVFGKIRYMNYPGCERKFDVKAFVRKFPGAAENAVNVAKQGMLPFTGRAKIELKGVAEGGDSDRVASILTKKIEQQKPQNTISGPATTKETAQTKGSAKKRQRKQSDGDLAPPRNEGVDVEEADVNAEEDVHLSE